VNNIIEKILKHTKGLDTHIILNSNKNSLTRFGDNEVSQNVSTSDTYAYVRIIKDSKAVKFVLNKFDDKSITESINSAKEKLKFVKKDSNIPFPTKTSVKIDSKKYFDEKTDSLSPEERVLKISKFLKFCKKTKRNAYGVINNTSGEVIIANSFGLFQKFSATQIDYDITVNKDGFYGKASASSFKDDIDYDSVNERALKKSDMAKNPIDIKPGKYTVIAEPLAVSGFLPFFGYMGFNALAYYENRSFASGNIGKKIFSEKLTITENPYDFPLGIMPFDLEGQPRERVILIDKGVLKNVVTDKKTSMLCNLKYTGHSLFEPNGFGAVPSAMTVESGEKSIEDIIKDTERAILVTEFHYTNPLKPKTLEITGMTRNGTYIVENGKIKRAVKNLRFTQNMVEAMNNIEELSLEREAFSDYGGGIFTPAFKIKEFNFTSSTEF
jgi:predicted Zn-dependent protease